MPEPRDLRMHEHDGRCVITAGRVVLFEYAAGDVVMRNIALAALRQLGFRGRVVAAVLGLTENYVATLHNAALRDGSAALVMQDRRGTPGKVTGEQWARARAWRAEGASDAEIGRRLQVAHTTIGRALGPREKAPAREREPGWAPTGPLFTGPEPKSLSRSPGLSPGLGRNPGLVLVLVLACLLPGGRGRGRCPRGACSGRGMRGRCCCMPSAGGPAPGRSWRLRRAGRTGGPGMRRCCQRSACASRWGRRPLSSSSTWPRRRQGRWPGSRRCRGCGRCGLQEAARSPASVRVPCSHHDAGWVFGGFQYPTPPFVLRTRSSQRETRSVSSRHRSGRAIRL